LLAHDKMRLTMTTYPPCTMPADANRLLPGADALFARFQNCETAAHLERVAAFSRLIAMGLVRSHHLSHDFIEHLSLMARLHDVGMVSVPQAILSKPSKLTAAEMVAMKTHVVRGVEQVDQAIADLCWSGKPAAALLRNIVACHHERLDGSGYPAGLRSADIPIEARIVAVADVFDALATTRPYRRVWTESEIAIEFRLQVASNKLDADCVAVLMMAKEAREAVLQLWPDPPDAALPVRPVHRV
jgi:two-component system response regulator RpfG